MHKRSIFLFSFSWLIVFNVFSQISITIQVSSTGVLQKQQLWNLGLVNTSRNTEYVHIVLTVMDANNNQPVFTAKSKLITLSRGAIQLKASDLNPIQYNYLDASLNVDRSPDGFLPFGNFVACYSVFKQQGEGVLQLSEDCIPVEVAPLHPPLLNSPQDEASILTKFPQLTWLPPTPVNLIGQLSYNLILVEVRKGQTPYDAIQYNSPVYSVGNFKTSYHNYPSSARSLDTGKVYAWRVIANNRNQFIAQSEVWTFKVEHEVESFTSADLPYIKLKKGSDPSVTVAREKLQFEYVNEANDSAVQFSITDLKDGKNSIIDAGTVPLKFGQNFINHQLSTGKKFKDKHLYMFSIFNSREEEWSIKFSYNKVKTK